MENQIIEAVTLGGSVANMDFSMWSLFLRADTVVKSVIILLLMASVWCWAIIYHKVINLRRLNSLSSIFEKTFWCKYYQWLSVITFHLSSQQMI